MSNIPSLQNILPCNILYSRRIEWKSPLPPLQGMSCLHVEIPVATATYSCVRWASVSPSTSPTTPNFKGFQSLKVPPWRQLQAKNSLTVKKNENRLGPRGCLGPSRMQSGQCGEITPPPRKASALEMGKVLEIAMQWAQVSYFWSAFLFLFLAYNTQKPQFQVSDFWKAWFLAPSLSSGKHVSVLISPVTSVTMSYVSTQQKGKKEVWPSVTLMIVRPWEPNKKERRQVWQSVGYSLIGVRWLRKVHRIALIGCHSDCRNVRTLKQPSFYTCFEQ